MNARRFNFLLLAGLASALNVATSAHAADAEERGFSYVMGIGRQSISYVETAASVAAVESRVSTSSPVLITGGVYVIDEHLLFSLASESTFAAGRGTESWRTDAATFNGVKITDPVLQRNGFSLSTNRLQMLGQYRVREQAFAVGGLAARSLSYKRFNFSQGTDKAVALPTDRTVEESVSELLAEAGVGIESERVRGSGSHYGARLTLALPLWRRLENTNVPDRQFTSARGYDISLEGRYSMAVRQHVHLGVFGQFVHAQRDAQTLGSAEMPKSRLNVLNVGLELLWKL